MPAPTERRNMGTNRPGKSRCTRASSETGYGVREEATGEQQLSKLEGQPQGKNITLPSPDKTRLKGASTGVLAQSICDLDGHEPRSNTAESSNKTTEISLGDTSTMTVPSHGSLHNLEDRMKDFKEMVINNADNSWNYIQNATDNERWLCGQKLENTEEIMAAAVLTSLSLSPVLPATFTTLFDKTEGQDDGVFNTDDIITDMEIFEKRNNRREKSRRHKKTFRTVFQCTWPSCGKMFSNSNAIIGHVRSNHLGPKDEDDDGFSDGEEEFYFNEIDVDTIRRNSERSLSPPIPHSRRHRSLSDPSPLTQTPVFSTSPHLDDNFTRPLRSSGSNHKPKTKRGHHTTTYLRRGRGDGRKCRKVYGMENKHLWCTQCRWKKACIKFID